MHASNLLLLQAIIEHGDKDGVGTAGNQFGWQWRRDDGRALFASATRVGHIGEASITAYVRLYLHLNQVAVFIQCLLAKVRQSATGATSIPFRQVDLVHNDR